MAPSPISSKSKRNARHAQRASLPKRTSSEGTSGSADSSECAAQSSSDDEPARASPPSSIEYQPEELDEPVTFPFKNGDAVWIKTEDGEWLQGTIAGSNTRRGATRQKEGLFFPVAFHNSRKYFAPLNGDIKPDNAEVRRLLTDGGWL